MPPFAYRRINQTPYALLLSDQAQITGKKLKVKKPIHPNNHLSSLVFLCTC